MIAYKGNLQPAFVGCHLILLQDGEIYNGKMYEIIFLACSDCSCTGT